MTAEEQPNTPVGPFQASERSCVVVGSLNPGIIQPPWLVANVPEAGGPIEDWGAELGLLERSIVFKNKHLRWQCAATRLVVTAISHEGLPGRAVASVLRVLTHTPVIGVGNNFGFIVEPSRGSSIASRLKPSLCDALAAAGLTVGLQSTTLQVPHRDALIGMTFEIAGEMLVKVAFNYHRDTTNFKDAADAAAKWDEDHENASHTLMELLQ